MERLYRKIFKYDLFLAKNVSLILLYVISGIFGFIAYSEGIIDSSIARTIAFEVKKLYQVILLGFALIYNLLINLTPFLIAWWIYVEYNNIFSSLQKLINTIPKSNKNKFKKVIYTGLVAIFSYCLITFLVSYFIDNGKIVVEIIEGLIFKSVGFISPVLTVIVVDMWSRESHIDKSAKSTWNVIAALTSFIVITIVSVLLIDRAPIVMWVFLLGGIIVKIVYLFKNIECIKID